MIGAYSPADGWLFFAVIMVLLFTIGRFLHDKQGVHVHLFSASGTVAPGHWVMALTLSGLALISGPIVMQLIKADNLHWKARDLNTVVTGSGWTVNVPEQTTIDPHFDNAILEVKANLSKDGTSVIFESAYSNILTGNGELDVRRVILNDKNWTVRHQENLTIELNTPINTSATIDGNLVELMSGGKTRLVFYYYNVSGTILRNWYEVKFNELAQVLTGNYHYTALHRVQVVNVGDNASARKTLVNVLDNFDPASLVDINVN